MLGRPLSLDVASQHGMLSVSSRRRSFSPAFLSLSHSKLARPSSKTDQQAYAGSNCLPLMAYQRCLLDVSVKLYLKVKLLQREEQPLAPGAPREPSKWVRNARRASERAKESDIDRSSFYL